MWCTFDEPSGRWNAWCGAVPKIRLLFGCRLVGLLFAVLSVLGVARGQGSAVISDYVPQAGIAGVTIIYVAGSGFGDQAGGSVSVGGVVVPGSNILVWTDDSIVFLLPENAQTGTLEVNGTATCPTDPNDYGYVCYSSEMSGTFTVFTPSYPSFYGPPLKVAPPEVGTSPQYVEGTWNFSNENGSGQYVLTQGGRNSDGSSGITGSLDYWDIYGDECGGPITGSLSANGVLTIQVPDTDVPPPFYCDGIPNLAWTEEWVVLNSGDATSNAWRWFPAYPSWPCYPPPANPQGDGDTSGYWTSCFDTPLFKSQTDIPTTESPQFLGWLATNGSQDPTYGAWQRVLPLSTDGLVNFSGRFVFEQFAPGAGASDGCHQQAADLLGDPNLVPFPAVNGVSGGGWYVNASGVWGSGHMLDGSTNLNFSDDIGINSDRVIWYQQHLQQCTITVYQTMAIDAVNGPVPYNTGGPYGSTSQHQEIIDNTLGPPLYCTNVIPSGSNPSPPVCKQYPPQ